MPGLEDLDRAIQRLEEAESRCREAASEANGAAKDLNHLILEVRRMAHGEAEQYIKDILPKEVEKQLQELANFLKQRMDKSVSKILSEVEKLRLG